MERRSFLQGASLLSAGLALGITDLGQAADLASARRIRYQLGFAAIAWNGNDVQAIKDISSLGYHGIQLRGNTYKTYGTDYAKTKELIDLLAQYEVKVPVFSGGNIDLGKPKETLLEHHKKQTAFAKAIGVQYYQFTNNSRPTDGSTPTTEMLRSYASLMAEVGKVVHDAGIMPVYHNHMHQLGETAQEVEIIMEGLSGSEVNLLLDIAHLTQGGGDPVAAINQYGDKIAVLHLKDVKDDSAAKSGYKFVELGQGRVDLKGVFAALDKTKFRGWGIVELDAVPEPGRTPLESATISDQYLKQSLKR